MFAYVGLIQTLKDLKEEDWPCTGGVGCHGSLHGRGDRGLSVRCGGKGGLDVRGPLSGVGG